MVSSLPSLQVQMRDLLLFPIDDKAEWDRKNQAHRLHWNPFLDCFIKLTISGDEYAVKLLPLPPQGLLLYAQFPLLNL